MAFIRQLLMIYAMLCAVGAFETSADAGEKRATLPFVTMPEGREVGAQSGQIEIGV